MTYTIITPQIPSYDEHGIVATFSEQSLAQLSGIQDQLIERLGSSIWLTPRRALYSTLMEIICDTDYGDIPRKQILTEWYDEYNQALADTLAKMPSFEITFTRLEVSQRAIIVRLADSRAFNSIRAEILSCIKLPDGTKIPPDITHCSLARFNEAIDLEDARNKIKDIKLSITENISSFQLLKDLGPPSFEPKLEQYYPLLTQ